MNAKMLKSHSSNTTNNFSSVMCYLERTNGRGHHYEKFCIVPDKLLIGPPLPRAYAWTRLIIRLSSHESCITPILRMDAKNTTSKPSSVLRYPVTLNTHHPPQTLAEGEAE